jgi:hypothetical protein
VHHTSAAESIRQLAKIFESVRAPTGAEAD